MKEGRKQKARKRKRNEREGEKGKEERMRTDTKKASRKQERKERKVNSEKSQLGKDPGRPLTPPDAVGQCGVMVRGSGLVHTTRCTTGEAERLRVKTLERVKTAPRLHFSGQDQRICVSRAHRSFMGRTRTATRTDAMFASPVFLLFTALHFSSSEHDRQPRTSSSSNTRKPQTIISLSPASLTSR